MKLTKSQRQLIDHCKSRLADIAIDLESIVSERTDVFDARSERWQESERGDTFTEETESIEELKDDVDDLFARLDDLV